LARGSQKFFRRPHDNGNNREWRDNLKEAKTGAGGGEKERRVSVYRARRYEKGGERGYEPKIGDGRED